MLSDQFLELPKGGVTPVEVEKEISKRLAEFWKSVFGYGGGDLKPSLEDHFTAIDLAANTGHHLGPAYSPRKLRAIRRLSIHRVFQILDLKYRQSSTIERLLTDLSKVAQVAIISVNWDVVVENHSRALGLDYDYGPILEPLLSNDRPVNGIPLFKLHGSANWVYCDSCRTLFFGPPSAGKDALHMGAFLESEDFEVFDSSKNVINLVRDLANGRRQCRLCGCRMSARVGTFSYRKDYAIQQFQTIWHRAFDALRESHRWLFIGYSMPEADFEFRQVLKSAELANCGRLRRSIQVVLKRDQDAAVRYGRFFGFSPSYINQEGLSNWAAKDFKDWLSTVERLA